MEIDVLQLAIPISIAIFAIAVIAVLTPRLLPAGPNRRQASTVTECPSCQHEIDLLPSDLRPLTGPERALVAQVRPHDYERPLAEFHCPYCDAYLVYATDKRPAEYIMTSVESTTSNNCSQCGKPLKRPPWPKGKYDGRLRDAPDLDERYGLTCSRCHSTICIACARIASEHRTEEGTLQCSRCFHKPIDTFHHF